MQWPLASDYQDAFQNPQICLQDLELKQGKSRTNSKGLPHLMTGHFAGVCGVDVGKERWAVRCFLLPVTDQQGRYDLISKRLTDLKVESLVEFEYLPNGILVRGRWY